MVKLVRDLIPQLSSKNIHNKFSTCVNDKQYIHFLSAKLFEECNEFVESNHWSIEELVDIMEVVNAFAELYGYDMKLLEKKRKEKAKDRGKFEKRILMEIPEKAMDVFERVNRDQVRREEYNRKRDERMENDLDYKAYMSGDY